MYRISRRGLLKSGVVAGVMAATGMPVQARQKGGTLRLGLSGASVVDGWDSRRVTGPFMSVLGQGAVFDCLTEVAANGELIGELAENWDATPDAKVWTFNLRKGVTFHNGKPFLAADVIASFALHRGTNSPIGPIIAAIADMSALTDHQVQFTLVAGNADFPLLVADPRLLIYPAGQASGGNGTGLYRVDLFDPGVRAVLRRVAGHYKDGRAGWFDTIDARAIGSGPGRLAALLAGQVDAVNDVPYDFVPDRRTANTIALLEKTGNRHFAFPMLTTLSPMDNLSLRRALKFAVDRPQMVDKVLMGHGTVGNDHPIGPANAYLDPGLAQTVYDPDRARFHLRQAGLGDLSLGLSVSDAGFAGSGVAAALYRASARSAGLAIEINPEPTAHYMSEIWQKRPWCAVQWSGQVTEDAMFTLAYQTGAAWNDTRWGHSRFQELLIAARSEFDSTKKRDMYFEMQALCVDEGGTVIPMFANFLDGYSTRLARPEHTGNVAGLDSHRIAERWWFA